MTLSVIQPFKALGSTRAKRLACMAAASTLLALCATAHRSYAQALLVSSLHDNAVQRVGLNGVVTTVASDLGEGSIHINPGGVYNCTVDRYGNVFYCISGQNEIVKVDRSGNQSLFAVTPNPASICFGKDGNMYSASYATGSVIQITPAGVQTTIATGLQDPYGITIDKHGTIYVACEGDPPYNGIYKIAAGGSPTFFAAVANPALLAIDGSGNLYASDWLAGNIYSISSSGSVSAYVTGFHDPLGIAFDGQNNLYVAETPSEWGGSGGGPDRIVEVQAGTRAESTLTYNVSGIDGIAFTPEIYDTYTPEPGTISMLLSGAAFGAAALRKRRQNRARANA